MRIQSYKKVDCVNQVNYSIKEKNSYLLTLINLIYSINLINSPLKINLTLVFMLVLLVVLSAVNFNMQRF